MKIFVVFTLFLFAVEPAIKPNGKRQQNDAQANSRTEPAIVVVDNRGPTENTDHRQRKANGIDASVWANWALVAVGIITFLAIWKQVKETANATQAMRDSIPLQQKAADAALLNAQAVINAERPWVMIQIKEDTVPHDGAGMFSKRSFQVTIFNYGKTPAHLTDCKGPIIKFLEAPDNDLPIPADYGTSAWNRRFLAPNDSIPVGDPIYPSDIKMGTVVNAALEGQRVKGDLIAYGLIEYSDGVSKVIYKTAFCFRHEKMPLSSMGGHFVISGPSVYNEYT